MKYIEVNFDGLPGPTHHYGGLGLGNVASQSNQGRPSNPKAAALQALAKMKRLADLGCIQAILPPQPRPVIWALEALCLQNATPIVNNYQRALLSGCWSSSNMWAANSATVTPSLDSDDEKIHVTPANLVSCLHRALETDYTSQILKTILEGPSFHHHAPLPASGTLSDEGAANHIRLSKEHGTSGLHLFVYGRYAGDERVYTIARQTREASLTISQNHKLPSKQVIFARQSKRAIEAGAFHNDVISMSNEYVMIYHEDAFDDTALVVREIKSRFSDLCGHMPVMICVREEDLSLEEAVRTYFFNSQIVTVAKNDMHVLAPLECETSKRSRMLFDSMIQAKDIPITNVDYVDLSQSMGNGGGPACLRLRIVLSEKELSEVHRGVLFNEQLFCRLQEFISLRYPHTLTLETSLTQEFAKEAHDIVNDLLKIFRLRIPSEIQA